MALDQSGVNLPKGAAVKFVIILGLVSLFADLTYEGARSINGPFLALLGANAVVIATVAGLGELLGYALRLVSGYLTDVTKRYWGITLAGYAINLFAVPALALAGRWEVAAALMLAERLGKAIRNPARDAMLAHAAFIMGRGWGFGLHEAMDQIGALAGPLVVAGILYLQGRHGYTAAYAFLLVPALVAMAILVSGWFLYPQPQKLEVKRLTVETTGLSRRFWVYIAAVAFIAAGFADYPLIAYHVQQQGIMSFTWVPLAYAVAMGTDAVAALILGAAFDRYGILVMIPTTLLSALFAPLVFWGNFWGVLLGMVLWGIGMGAQESVIRAAVAELVPLARRASAYGIFQTGYGLFWFLGSFLMGLLYERALPYLIAFSVLCQLLAALLFIVLARREADAPGH